MRVGFLVGLAIVVLLVAWQGVATVVDLLAGAGWSILLVALFIPPDLLLKTASLQALFLPGRTPRFADTARATWIGTSVNLLLPVATIGGEIVKARILVLRGTRGVDAAAAVVLDKTVQALSLLLWALVGIAILAAVAPSDEPVVAASIVGAGLLAIGIAGFALAQYAGAFGSFARPAARLSGSDRWRSLIESAGDLDATIRALYHRPGAIALSTFLRLAKRVLMAARVWLVAWLVGHPIGIAEAVMLNSLAAALRGAAFVVPGGLGVQEAGYIVVGTLVGVPPGVMLAVSLATRLGELIECLPGILAWQLAEGEAYRSRRGRAPLRPPSG